MKRFVVIIILVAFLCFPTFALAVKGVVVYVKSGCGYYIVETVAPNFRWEGTISISGFLLVTANL